MMDRISRIVGDAIPYEMAVASAQYGLHFKTEGYHGAPSEFVKVETLGCLNGPPRGPWYEMTVVNEWGQEWTLEVYLHHRPHTARPLPEAEKTPARP